MTKQTTTPTPQLPLAGGDYVDRGSGLKQVAESTAPTPGKTEAAAAAPRRVTTATAPAPETAATASATATPARTTTSTGKTT